MVREELNPDLQIGGVLLTMFDARTNLAHQVVDEVRAFFGDQVFNNVIPRNVRLSEAPSFGLPVTSSEPSPTHGSAPLPRRQRRLRLRCSWARTR